MATSPFPLEPVGDTHRKDLPEGFLLALREGSQGGVTLPIMVLPPPSPSPSGAPESVSPLDDITATFHAVQSRNACPCHSLSPDVIFPEERCVAAHEPHRQTHRLRPSSADHMAPAEHAASVGLGCGSRFPPSLPSQGLGPRSAFWHLSGPCPCLAFSQPSFPNNLLWPYCSCGQGLLPGLSLNEHMASELPNLSMGPETLQTCSFVPWVPTLDT